jgi:hypothetical protein
MSNEECPNCSGHNFLNCIRSQFVEKLAKLVDDTIEEVKAHNLENETPEVASRKESYPLELSDHLLWLAASIYTGEGAQGSEAIYELAQALEELGSEPDEDEDPTEEIPGPRLVSSNDVN